MKGSAQLAHGRAERERLLEYVERHQAEHGWAPTVREIQAELRHQSPASIHRHLRKLHEEGKLVLGGGPRMIRLTTGSIDLRYAEPVEPVADAVVPSAIDAERRRR